MKSSKRWTGYVVTVSDGTVFAVFGSAMQVEANQYATAQNSRGNGPMRFYVDLVTRSNRPNIGAKL